MKAKRLCHRKRGCPPWRFIAVVIVGPLVALLGAWQLVSAQGFDSGSDGSDGALNLTTPGTIVFDPDNYVRPDG
jgi:hypothetical protein